MAALDQRPRSTSASMSRVTGPTSRRSDLQNSDPLPGPFRCTVATPFAENELHQATNTAQFYISPWQVEDGRAVDRHLSTGPSIIMSTAPSKGSLVQSPKRSGRFRATMKRIFGSKQKRASIADHCKEYYISDPGNLTSAVEKHTDNRVVQSVYQPPIVVRESALRSHAPLTQGQASAPHIPTSVSEDFSQRRRGRRNTLPSVAFTDQEAQVLGDLPPASQSTLRYRGELEDLETQNQLRRRSKSADALNDLIQTNLTLAGHFRDRAEEIAYWRQSKVHSQAGVSERSQDARSTQPRKASAASTQQPEAPHRTIVPAQSFDFGLLETTQETLTLEQRVNTLEVKLFDFEFAIAKLQGHDIPKPVLPPKGLKRRSAHDLFPVNTSATFLTSSSVNDLTFLSSADSSPLPTTEIDTSYNSKRESRATTIRPSTAVRRSELRSNAPSPPSSPAPKQADQYESLMTLIREEQVARMQLENKVYSLQREVDALRTPIYAEIRSINYPTPSPELKHQAPKPLHRAAPFHLEKAAQESSRFSTSDLGSETDDGVHDVYGTPQESRYTFDSPHFSPIIGVV